MLERQKSHQAVLMLLTIAVLGAGILVIEWTHQLGAQMLPETIPVTDALVDKIHPDLLAAAKVQSHLDVLVYLKNHPNQQVAQQVKQSYRLELEVLSTEMRTLMQPYEGSDAVPEQTRQQLKSLLTQHDATTQDMRRSIYSGIQNQIAFEQDSVQRFIEQGLGGQVTHRIVLVNALAVTLPSVQIGSLANRAEVVSIEPNRPIHPCLDSSVPTIGAPTWWNSGYDGGAYDIGLIDSGLFYNAGNQHSALNSHGIENHYTVGTTAYDKHGHGTLMTGVVCSTHSQKKGVAFGLDKIINSKSWGTASEEPPSSLRQK